MASTYLSRTPSGAYYLKATFSFWFKRSGLGEMGLFGRRGSNSTVNLSTCHFGGDDSLLINFRDSGGTSQYYQITNRKFRDTNAWYHFHYIIEGDNSTQGDRSRLYINGVRETDFSLNNNPSSNSYQVATFLSSDGAFTVGRALRSQTDTFGNFDGSISHFHCSTGYAYEPTVFGETDATTGEWKIKTSPTFTPGTDGFTILKDGNTITDQSANSNNFSLTAGTLTKTEDCPSNVFATWNNLVNKTTTGNQTYSNGNTTIDFPAGGDGYMYSTLAFSSGKFYAEFKINSFTADRSHAVVLYTDITSTGLYLSFCKTGNANVITSFGSAVQTGLASFSGGDIIGMAVDATNGTVDFTKNGSAYGSQVTGLSSNFSGKDLFFGFLGEGHSSETRVFNASANFGNGYFGTTAVSSAGTNASGIGIFEYDVPANFTALSTKGLNL